jgi:hypothetical protein
VTTATQQTRTEQEIIAEVERLSAERGDLEQKYRRAQAELQGIGQRILALKGQQVPLATPAFSGDGRAATKLKDLDNRLDKAKKRETFLRNAVGEFGRMVAEAKEKESEEDEKLARFRYSAIYRDREALWEEARAAAQTLKEKLEAIQALDSPLMQQAQKFDDRLAQGTLMSSSRNKARFYLWGHDVLGYWIR